MRAEREKIQFADYTTGTKNGMATLHPVGSHQVIPLNPLQKQYLEILEGGLSVEQMVLHYLKQGWLVRFSELYELIHVLVQNRLIINQSWNDLFFNQDELHKAASDGGSSPTPQPGSTVSPTVSSDDLKDLPFFHDLNQELLSIFAQRALRYRTASHTRLCTQGQHTRDLYVLTEGQAAVLRSDSGGHRRLISRLGSPAVFGEGGFLLNRPRSADVLTLTPSTVIRIQHHQNFDRLIQESKATQLHRRLWVLHALATSRLFKEQPLEVWSDVATLGQIRQAPTGTFLFQEGTHGMAFFILIQGEMSVWQSGKKINTLLQGACFGEVALMASLGARTASVKAEKTSLVVEISAEEFFPLLARNLFFAQKIETQAYEYLRSDQQRSRHP